MPGVFGWIDLGQDTAGVADAPSLLAEMARRMGHSGRERVDTWTDPGGAFAIGRVTLRDLDAIPWPVIALRETQLPPDGRLSPRAFLDGSDVAHGAACLSDLEHRGRAALPSLRGSFTAACWEPDAQRLTLAVDRRASRPLAYAIAGSRVYFAPEVKALLAAPGVDRTLDEAAIGVFLGAGYLLAHQTLFAGIHRLCGGEALIAQPGRVHVEAYWRYHLREQGDGTRASELEEELAELVRGAVERDLGDPERAVVFLSGGVDSRAIAGVAQDAARRQGRRVRTVTWAVPSDGNTRAGSDREVAQRVAAALGTRHETVARQVSAWGRRLTGMTYLLDGLTDLPAYHPHEHAIMRDLADGGALVVLRGDECFGWNPRVASLEEGWLSLNLRSPRALRHVGRFLRAPALGRVVAAAEAALAEAGRPYAGEPPDDAKDQLYFRHRLQSYLGSAAYLKQVVLDHRAPLLDDTLLDFNARVPAALRADKRLFCRAAARLAPELFALPLARRGNLEDWGLLLTSPSPVRCHVEAELADRESGIWELFDREALRAALPPLGGDPQRAVSARAERVVKRVARTALRVAPSIERQLLTRAHRAGLRFDQLCLRVMVLKAWHDLFVRGDGSRSALEARLSRLPG